MRLSPVPGRGFSLIGPAELRRRLADAIREYDHPLPWLSPSSRLYVVLLTLFFPEGPPQIKQLQRILGHSRSTTIRVLDAAGDWLKSHHLRLVRRQNRGCMIEGDELDWRDAVVSVLRETCGDAGLLATLRGTGTVVDVSFGGKTALDEALLRIWALLEIPLIKRSIAPLEDEFARTLSDQAYAKLFIYLALVVYRNRAGRSIAHSPEIPASATSTRVLATAKEIITRLQAHSSMALPEPEIAWIARRLPADDRPTAIVSSRSKATKDESDLRIREAVDRIVLEAALSLHPSLRADAELFNNLTAHLKTLLDPQAPGESPTNGLLRDVKIQFPYAYSVAKEVSALLTSWLGRDLEEAEIGDIAICFIAAMERLRRVDIPTKKVMVVCAEGTVTAWLLVSRLRAEFPDVEVVEVISARELEDRKRASGVDFIVSTIPLRQNGIPIMHVSPLLGLEDCRHLKDMFERKGKEMPKNGLVPPAAIHLSDLITEQRIELGVAAGSWEEVVEKAGRRLLDSGAIDGRFIQAMKDVIREYGPYMVIWPGAVLLHAAPQGVRRLSIQLVSLRKPVQFGHPDHDPVQIAIVLGAPDGQAHTTALVELNRMMQDEEARSAIANTLHKSVVLHWVSRYSRLV